MQLKNSSRARTRKEILVALILAVCLLLSVVALVLIEDNIGTPITIGGNTVNVNVKITEICSSNSLIIATDAGEYPDYIELYNGGETFNLKDFGLSNNVGNSIDYIFGDIEFKADTYLIVYLDDKNVPFKLSSSGGEYIALVSSGGVVIDSTTTVRTASNEVMLRDGKDFVLSMDASPGYPNTEEGLEAFKNSFITDTLALSINEIFIDNQSLLPDFEGTFCDIIELKNTSNAILSTAGYYISDSVEKRDRYSIPETELAPGDILLIFASGKDMVSKNGEYHSDFKLSSEESVVLSYGGKYVEKKVVRCALNCSLSRVLDEENKESYTQMMATPGYENNDEGREALELSRIYPDAPLAITELLLSQDGTPYKGRLQDVIEISNISDKEISTKGWYISDSEGDPYKYALPEKTLKPNECIILYARNDTGENVCGFALSSGESVYLTAPDFRRSDLVPCNSAGAGLSKNRITENGEAIYVSGNISMGFANNADGENSFATAVRPLDVEISEIVASNRKYVPGPYETYHDFIELHNRTGTAIVLDGYYLSDDPEEPRKCSLDGITIPANGYKVIILSSDGINTPSGYPVCAFSVSSSGETVCLSKGDDILDAIAIPSLSTNAAYGRADGADGFSILQEATPNAKNSNTATAKAIAPTTSLPQGVYKQDTVTVELKGEGEIYFTLDCTEPTANSNRYTAPLTLSKTTVIRCISVAEGKKQSNISDFTFVINEPDTLETISVVTTPKNLWDYYTGIYETGPRAASTFPYDGANYYYRWEREASVSFFDKDGGGFSEPCGIRIFGGLSRALPKKSLAFFFRSAYGSGELNYQLFEDEELNCYESFIVRNGGQDFKYSLMRDAMLTTIAREKLGLDTQNCRPVVVYLNGEYWGLYFIREKLNENYVAGHYNVSSDKVKVDIASGRRVEEYQEIIKYAQSHDLSVKENYEYICSVVDVENFATYLVSEIILGNTDNGNIRFFTYEGGKWRWMLYDVDHAFRSVTVNTVSDHLNPGGTGGGDQFPTRLRNALLKNPDFKKMFLEEMAYQLEYVWTPEIIASYTDSFRAMIENDIQRECDRWSKSYSQWDNSVESLKTFANSREGYIERYVKDYFGLSDSQMRSYGFDI